MIIENNRYQLDIEITSHMVDVKELITPTYLFYLMQDIAVQHADAIGNGWNYLHPMGIFWALTKIDVEIVRRPEWREKISLFTWAKKSEHIIQPRDFEITTAEGEPLVRATSNWVLLDMEGKSHLIKEFRPCSNCNTELHALPHPVSRLRQPVPAENLTYKPVVYSNVDINHHANNCAYVTWVMDSLSHQFHQNHELKFIAVNFLQQTHAEDSYGIAQKELAPNDLLFSIYAQKGNIEVCRIRTVWEDR